MKLNTKQTRNCFGSVSRKVLCRFRDYMSKRQLTGTIISNKMQKTIVVKVERIKEHKRYKRRYRVHKKYKAHDEKEEYKVGDKVVIEESRPLSRDKRWKVIKKLR